MKGINGLNGRPNGLGTKNHRLETSTNVWKCKEELNDKVKGINGLNGRPNGLGTKNHRLETSTNVWECEEEPNEPMCGNAKKSQMPK